MRRMGLELVRSNMTGPRQFFCSGDRASETGIYRVHHTDHRLSHEVTVLRGQSFPVCTRCSNEVHFELIRSCPLADTDGEFRVVLHSLPVIEDDGEQDEKERVS